MKKLPIPPEILEKIAAKCKPKGDRDYFVVSDLVEPLRIFIDRDLYKLNQSLYDYYKYHQGTDARTLRHAWGTGTKITDGATENLRNLLCYFGFKLSWKEALSTFNMDENMIANHYHSLLNVDSDMNVKPTAQKEASIEPLVMFASRILIELSTRKAFLKINISEDSIEDIYNSWYHLFNEIRKTLKELPPNYHKHEIVNYAHVILNDILRPHLTEHQANFRKWINHHKLLKQNIDISIYALQMQYPNFLALQNSLEKSNMSLMKITELFIEFLDKKDN